MAVQKACKINADFHPRFDATSRCYRYRLFCQPLRNPIRERFAWRVWPAINGELLARCSNAFSRNARFFSLRFPDHSQRLNRADRDESSNGCKPRTMNGTLKCKPMHFYIGWCDDWFLSRWQLRRERFPAEAIARSLAEQATAGGSEPNFPQDLLLHMG